MKNIMCKKLTYQQIKSYIDSEEGNGCELITTEEELEQEKIKQNKGISGIKLKIQCKCGKIFDVIWNNFKNGQKQCQKCGKNNGGLKHRLTIEDINKYLIVLNNGTILISKSYRNNNDKLKFKCVCGTKFCCTWSNFTKKQNKCSDCLKEPYKWNLKEIVEYLKSEEGNGCELLSKIYYNGYKQKLNFKCCCGNIFYKTWNAFLAGQKQCNKCANKSRSDKSKTEINDIKIFIKEHGCVLISNFYENNKTKLTLECACKDKFEASWNEIKNGKLQCNKCGMKLKSGENSSLWKGGATSVNTVIRRTIEYKNWRKSVFRRDNYTCQCCGDNKGGNLNAHHIKNFSSNEELRFDVDNGITLCKSCHDFSIKGSFHHIYGTKNNTKEQLEEYIQQFKINI